MLMKTTKNNSNGLLWYRRGRTMAASVEQNHDEKGVFGQLLLPRSYSVPATMKDDRQAEIAEVISRLIKLV